jgi:hypothetical protein
VYTASSFTSFTSTTAWPRTTPTPSLSLQTTRRDKLQGGGKSPGLEVPGKQPLPRLQQTKELIVEYRKHGGARPYCH